jgi:hypothetical protein
MSGTVGLTGVCAAAEAAAVVYPMLVTLTALTYLFSRNTDRHGRALTVLRLLLPTGRRAATTRAAALLPTTEGARASATTPTTRGRQRPAAPVTSRGVVCEPTTA